MKNDKLSAERLSRLTELGVLWHVFNEVWESAFALLKNFNAREGHCAVSPGWEEEGFALGEWVARQRSSAYSGKLAAERREKLDGLGFVWDTRAFAWERGFAALQRFQRQHNHCLVPATLRFDDVELGDWVVRQRQAHRVGKLPEDRFAALASVGFVWDALEAAWEEAFALLNEYKKREGHCRVPDKTKVEGFSLGKWVTKQRADARQGKILPERRKRLQAIGFDWGALK